MSRFTSRALRRALALTAATAAVLTLAACSGDANASSGSAGETRVYESEFGDVELPATIERVVSVDFYTPAALVDIGVTPVGVVNSYFTDTDNVAIPEQYTTAIGESGAESIGEYYELNLEAVAQADPDVIIATNDFLPMDDPLRPELEKIAPIVTFTARDGDSWRVRAEAMAEIFDREDELAPLVEEYETRRDGIKAEYADLLADEVFAVFVPVEDEWATYASTHFETPILRDLGARFREQQADEITVDGFPGWLSYESLDRLSNTDVILTMPGRNDEFADILNASTIWQNLPAVQNGLVFDYIPLGPTGSFGWAMENLNDLEAVLAEVQAKLDESA